MCSLVLIQFAGTPIHYLFMLVFVSDLIGTIFLDSAPTSRIVLSKAKRETKLSTRAHSNILKCVGRFTTAKRLLVVVLPRCLEGDSSKRRGGERVEKKKKGTS